MTLPGVSGDAATAASFAGQWSERCKSAVTWFVSRGSTRHPRSETTATQQPAFMLCLNTFGFLGIGAFSILTWVIPHRIPFTAGLVIGR